MDTTKPLDTSKTFVQKIKAKYKAETGETCTPYRVAKILKLSPTGIYNFIDRDSVFDNETGYAIARYLGVDSGYVLSCLSAERSKSPEVKDSWVRVARLLEAYTSRAAIIVLCIFALGFMGKPILANANALQCILCQILIVLFLISLSMFNREKAKIMFDSAQT